MPPFKDFQAIREADEAYKYAAKIQQQEAFALAIHSVEKDPADEYNGHRSVMDLLHKIDSMVKMAERAIKDDTASKSAQKTVDVIASLYDLAQAKLNESKKQCIDYMKKATGVTPLITQVTPARGNEAPPEDNLSSDNINRNDENKKTFEKFSSK